MQGRLPYPGDDGHLLEFYVFLQSTKAISDFIRSQFKKGLAPIGKYTWFPKYSLAERETDWETYTNALTDETLKASFTDFLVQLRYLRKVSQSARQTPHVPLTIDIIKGLDSVEIQLTRLLREIWGHFSEPIQDILIHGPNAQQSTFGYGYQGAKDLIDMALDGEPCFRWFLLRTALQLEPGGIQAWKAYISLYHLCKLEGRYSQALKYKMKASSVI